MYIHMSYYNIIPSYYILEVKLVISLIDASCGPVFL